MAPKSDSNDPSIAGLVELFKSIGLSEPKAKEAMRSPKNAASLKELIERNRLAERSLDEKQASLIWTFSSQSGKIEPAEESYVVDAIVDAKLKSVEQVSAAIKYVESHSAPVNEKEFNAACGVGVNLTEEDIATLVESYLSSNVVAGWSAVTSVLGTLKTTTNLRWANPLAVKTAVEHAFTEKFGTKESAKGKAKKEKAAPAAKTAVAEPHSEKTVFEEGFLGKLHKPGGNPQINPRLRDTHLAATRGKVFTRFPPEPNGYLHIGHSKAIFINFGYAAYNGGHCYLRYDDTNPEKEEAKYFESILEIVRWLGYEPYKITYSSDYFDQLHDLAVELIRRDKAYVCHCTAEQMKINRGEGTGAARIACVHRSRPVAESLAEFEGMKDGKFERGEVTLRMKQDLEDGNTQMWDLVAYRTLNAPHHRTGSKWKIYPTYDFTHCLVDSFENISHSLCTTEFIASRQSYDWLCDALEVYKPRQSEYGRLNLQGTVMSKRKILKLVEKNYVSGWDDPRLYTLVALRRRGIPPAAIVSFVGSLGVSTAITHIQTTRFEQSIRQHLENTAPRLAMVLHPLKVTLVNLPEDHRELIHKQLHPKFPELGYTDVPFTRTIYIDRDDFRAEATKDYFRLMPGQKVGLFHGPKTVTCITYESHTTNASTGEIDHLICNLEVPPPGAEVSKPKAFIQWVAEDTISESPVHVDETRIFHSLFNSDNPAGLDDYLQDLNPNSLEVVKGAVVEVGFWSLAKKATEDARREAMERLKDALKGEVEAEPKDKDTPKPTVEQLIGNEVVRFQGLRVAYFTLDKDSRLGCLAEDSSVTPGRRPGDKLILNRIVSLKEDSGKKSV